MSSSGSSSLDSIPEGFYLDKLISNIKFKGEGSRERMVIRYESGKKERVYDLDSTEVYQVLTHGNDRGLRISAFESVVKMTTFMLTKRMKVSGPYRCWNNLPDRTGVSVQSQIGVYYAQSHDAVYPGFRTGVRHDGVEIIHLTRSEDSQGRDSPRITLRSGKLYLVAGTGSLPSGSEEHHEMEDQCSEGDGSPTDETHVGVIRGTRKCLRIATSLSAAGMNDEWKVVVRTTFSEGDHLVGGLVRSKNLLVYNAALSGDMLERSLCQNYKRTRNNYFCRVEDPVNNFCCGVRAKGGYMSGTERLSHYPAAGGECAGVLSSRGKKIRKAVELMEKTHGDGRHRKTITLLSKYTGLPRGAVIRALAMEGLGETLRGEEAIYSSCRDSNESILSERLLWKHAVNNCVVPLGDCQYGSMFHGAEMGLTRVAEGHLTLVPGQGDCDDPRPHEELGRNSLLFELVARLKQGKSVMQDPCRIEYKFNGKTELADKALCAAGADAQSWTAERTAEEMDRVISEAVRCGANVEQYIQCGLMDSLTTEEKELERKQGIVLEEYVDFGNGVDNSDGREERMRDRMITELNSNSERLSCCSSRASSYSSGRNLVVTLARPLEKPVSMTLTTMVREDFVDSRTGDSMRCST